MINELIKLATHLDSKGLKKEADYLDGVIKKAYYGDTSGQRAGSVGTATKQQLDLTFNEAKALGESVGKGDGKKGILYETDKGTTLFFDGKGRVNNVTGKAQDAYGVDLQNLPLYYQTV